MTTKLETAETTSVSRWLAELHMECYKKNLEQFDTVKPLLDLKDPELKKLGVINSKDRSVMLTSLASFKSPPATTTISSSCREEPNTSPVLVRAHSTSDSKSVSRRSSLRNFNLKGLLGNSGSKKSKKSRDNMTTPPLTSALDLQETPPNFSPPPKMYPIPDYEELREVKADAHSPAHKAIPNEYVPSPDEMEQFRGRAYTVGVCQLTPTSSDIPLRRVPLEGISRRDSMATTNTTASDEDARSTTSSSLHQSHHLSVISMESGLSFGYDVEINPSIPLEIQPWFHGKISRNDANTLLHDEGDFLVRENTAMANTYTLSMHWGGQFHHSLIQCDEVVNSRNGTTVKYSFDGGAFDSIPELIYHHLKYQIPIDRETQNLLITPIHRPGTRVPFAPHGYHHHHQPHERMTAEQSSPSPFPRGEDHTHMRSEVARQYLYSLRSSSMSPGASSSTRPSPGRDVAMRTSNSSGDLLETDEIDRPVVPRSAVSPPPTVGAAPVRMRSRAMTDSRFTRTSSSGGRERSLKRDSFGDYEVMESVSLLGSPPPHRKGFGHSGSPSPAPQGGVATPVGMASGGDVKYAEIQHMRRPQELTRRGTYSGPSHSPSVKYAEVRFTRKQQPQQSTSPHPFSLYDTVQSGQPARVNPYQSRAEILAQKLQLDSSPRSSPTSHPRLNRMESAPHPFSSGRYSTHSLPRHTSSPQVMDGISEEVTPVTPNQPATLQDSSGGGKMHSLPDRVRRRVHAPHDSAMTARTNTNSAVAEGGKAGGKAAVERVPKSLPGYEMLVSLHNTLSHNTDTELAFHLTRADAVAFLLTPRPGEDKEVWKERVQKTTSSSGLYVGLQTLADTEGEKLWKKLYFRHLSLSHMVALAIVSAGDTIERARMLRRFIELAFILQSASYGNLFSFISIMQGITCPQVQNMTQTWQLFHSVFPESSQTHKQLQDILSSLGQGVSIYATDQISVPAIQHLRTVFHFEEPSFPGHAPSSSEDHTLLGHHANLLVGLNGIHAIIKHVSRFSYNARKRLEPLQYNVKLMDFFSQDFARSYMHSIGVTSEDQMERRRRFDVLLSALVDRVERTA